MIFSLTLTLSTMRMRVQDGHVTTVEGQICPGPCLIGLTITVSSLSSDARAIFVSGPRPFFVLFLLEHT